MRTAASVVVAAFLALGCAGQRGVKPEPVQEIARSEPEPAVSEEQPAAEQPASEQPAAEPVPEPDPDPPITRPFALDAVMVGVCTMGGRASHDHEAEGPVVFRDEGAPPFREGEPLWVITAGGGLERAQVKHAFRHCPVGSDADWEDDPEERARVLKERGWDALRCWPAAELRSQKPLRCSAALKRSPQFKIMFEVELEREHLLALPRDMAPPKVVSMTSSMGLYGARCQDEEKDYDEPGAFIELSDPETEISRYARAKFGLGERWARRIVSFELEGPPARLHVIHAVDKRARRTAKGPRWDLMLLERDGAFQQIWPRARQRHQGAKSFIRNHFCELPFWAPLPNVAIESPSGELLVLISEDDGARVGLWSLGTQPMTARRTFSVEHEIAYF